MTKQEIIDRIEKAYAFRIAGDKESMSTVFAHDGEFRIAGIGLSLPGVMEGNVKAVDAVGALIDHYKFIEVKMRDVVVEGSVAAIRSVAKIAPDGGKGPAHAVELFDLVTFDGEGKIKSFVQFVDAAFIATLARRVPGQNA